MNDKEKVIDYLQWVLRMKNEHGYCVLPFDIVEDTLALLNKRHCAKPIKLEELRNAPNGYIGWINYSADGNYIKFITSFDGFFMHDDPIEGKISMIDFEDSLYCEPESDYGKTYVLWDDKPTDDQIKAYWEKAT